MNVSVLAGEPLHSALSGVAAQLSVTSLISNTHSVSALMSEGARVHACVGQTSVEGTLSQTISKLILKTRQSDKRHPPTRAPVLTICLINYLLKLGFKELPALFLSFFLFYFGKLWSELVFLYITTITAKLCGLITMALLPCDTLGMTKPSRKSDRDGRESNFSVATDTKVSQPN